MSCVNRVNSVYVVCGSVCSAGLLPSKARQCIIYVLGIAASETKLWLVHLYFLEKMKVRPESVIYTARQCDMRRAVLFPHSASRKVQHATYCDHTLSWRKETSRRDSIVHTARRCDVWYLSIVRSLIPHKRAKCSAFDLLLIQTHFQCNAIRSLAHGVSW